MNTPTHDAGSHEFHTSLGQFNTFSSAINTKVVGTRAFLVLDSHFTGKSMQYEILLPIDWIKPAEDRPNNIYSLEELLAVPENQEKFDAWKLSITGKLESEKTELLSLLQARLDELVKEAVRYMQDGKGIKEFFESKVTDFDPEVYYFYGLDSFGLNEPTQRFFEEYNLNFRQAILEKPSKATQDRVGDLLPR